MKSASSEPISKSGLADTTEESLLDVACAQDEAIRHEAGVLGV